jgi:thiol-disulfide isomerase/thioredoxin
VISTYPLRLHKLALFGALVTISLTTVAAYASRNPSAKLTVISKGAMSKAGYYIPQRLTLTPTKPAGVKKEPKYEGTPMYGVIHFGFGKSDDFTVVLDEPNGEAGGNLYVDSNRDGDLTNDAPMAWERRAQKFKNQQTGKDVVSVIYSGQTLLKPKWAGKSDGFALSMYRFSPETAKMRELPADLILYYRDYGREGKIKLGQKVYSIMLLDELATGRYDQIAHGTNEPMHVSLLIDRDGNGKFGKGEQYDLNKPFNIGGTTYEVDKIAKDGSRLALRISKQQVAELPFPQDLSVGKPVLAFSHPLIGDKSVNFPGDYKGKIVLLDFWATWCGPCRVELPGLIQAYEKYHDKGFEILGVSLDKENQLTQVQAFLKEYKMTWPQIYDGKYWNAEIGQMYGIDSIPHPILVDGTTGKIVADGNALRGEVLEDTIAKALAGNRTASEK